MPGVPATPCKKGYKKLKTRLHEEAGGGERRGRGGIYSGYSLARMQKRLFRGPADRARDIIGPGRVHICMCIRLRLLGPVYTLPPVDNYSGQLDIPRAYKHARTHTSVPIPPPSPFSRCSANPIFDYATMRSLDRQSRGKSDRAPLEHPRCCSQREREPASSRRPRNFDVDD